MNLNDRTKIEFIHNSDIYGCFVESGCGVALTSKLMAVAGASKTIFAMEAPYNKEIQFKRYPDTSKHRAVSWEGVAAIMESWVPDDRCRQGNTNFVREVGGSTYWRGTNFTDVWKINTVYVAQFQIGDESNTVSTHGWIGLWMFGKTYYYHVSIHKAMSRHDYLDTIGNIGVELITSRKNGIKIPADCCIDMVIDSNGNHVPLDEMFEMLTRSVNENFVVAIPGKDHNTTVRMEHLFRDNKETYMENNNMIIFKGSFNPPHNAHIDCVRGAELSVGSSKTVMMIAMEIYQKGCVDSMDMSHRVKMLNDLGFPVIVTRSGYFNENVNFIRNKFGNSRINFIVGTDTANRIINSTYHIAGAKDVIDKFGDGKLEMSVTNDEVVKFKNDFDNVHFIIIERGGNYKISEELLDKGWLGDYFSVCPDIKTELSSSEIRKMLDDGRFEEIKSKVPANIHDNLVNLHKQKSGKR